MAGGFSVTISAVDRATSTIDAVNKRLAASTAGITRMGRGLSTLGRNTGLTQVASAVEQAVTRVGTLSASIAGLGGAASVGGMIALANSTARFNQQQQFTAQYVGLTARRLAVLRGAAELAGVGADTLSSALQGLRKNQTDALGGRNQEALAYFRQLHIGLKNADGSLRSVDDMLPQVADAISRIRDPVLQARVATAMFGGEAQALLPFLRQGSDGLRRLTIEAERYTTVTDASQGASIRLAISWAALKLAAGGAANEITEQLSPGLSAVESKLADIIEKNRTWIAQMAGQDINKWAARAGLLSDAEKKRLDVKTGLQGSDLADAGIAAFASKWLLNLGGKIARATGMPGIGLLAGANKMLAGATLAGETASLGLGWMPLLAGAVLYGRHLTGDDAIPFDPAHPYGGAGGLPRWLRPSTGTGPVSPNQPGFISWLGRHMPTWLGGTPTSTPARTADTTMSSTKRAFLDSLSMGESRGYNEGNPRDNQGRVLSTAHGRYQFLDGTDRQVSAETGLPGQDPVSQDRKGWYYAAKVYRQNTGRDLEADAKDPARWESIAYALNKVWPSLPGGSQQNTTMAQWKRHMADNMAAYGPQARATGNPAPSADRLSERIDKLQVGAAPAVSGAVKTEIILRGAPAGTTATSTATGAVESSTRIEHAFPLGTAP